MCKGPVHRLCAHSAPAITSPGGIWTSLPATLGTDVNIERVINFGQMTDCCLKEDIKGLLAATK